MYTCSLLMRTTKLEISPTPMQALPLLHVWWLQIICGIVAWKEREREPGGRWCYWKLSRDGLSGPTMFSPCISLSLNGAHDAFTADDFTWNEIWLINKSGILYIPFKGKYFTYGKICCNRKDMCIHTWHVRSFMYIYIDHDKSFCSATSHCKTPQIFLASLLTVNNSICGKLKKCVVTE